MAENKNLALWESVEATDPAYTKQFSRGGGFKGTSTNATYLVKKATAKFGPVGIGWGWKVLDERLLEGAKLKDGSVAKVHRVHLQLWYELDGKRGEIEHFGQTDFVGSNRHGSFTDEEAPKKSLTDALSKCLSMLGFAADIHLGMYDDNRYVRDLKQEFNGYDEFAGKDDAKAGNDNAKSNEEDRPSSHADLMDDMKREIDDLQSQKEIAAYMNHKDTKADLKSLTKDESESIVAYAKDRLKYVNEEKQAAE
jgi:hypothetical protein